MITIRDKLDIVTYEKEEMVPYQEGALTGWAEAKETSAHFEAFKDKMKGVFIALSKRNQELAEQLLVLDSKNRQETQLKDAKIENLSARVAQLEAMVAAKDKQIAQVTEKSAADLKAAVAERAQAVQAAVNNTQQACNSQLASLNAQLSSANRQLATANNARAYLTNLANGIHSVVNSLDSDLKWYAARGEGPGVQVPPSGWNAFMAVNHIKAQIVNLSTTATSYLRQI